jgi:SAM-dependent methyltransferase
MSSYLGDHALLYDLFYSQKDYKTEAGFIDELIKQNGIYNKCRLLELACGTGNHSFELEKYGYEITATDYSKSMLEQANFKKDKYGSKVNFSFCDMTDLRQIKSSFETVICLFDSIGYVLTNDNIKRVLDGVHDKLANNGIFIFEFWHAAAMLKGYDPVRIKRWKMGNSDILRISETTIDTGSQSCSVNYSIYKTNRDGTFSFLEETQKNRFFLLQEMMLFLETCHFKIIHNFAGYSKNEIIGNDTWHIVIVAQKIEKK